MYKKEIVKQVSKSTGVSNAVVQQVVDGFIEAVQSNLLKGIEVRITGFLNFNLKVRKERVFNSLPGEEVLVPKHYYLNVNVSEGFKKKLKEKTVY